MRTGFEESGEVRDVDILAALVALWRGGASGALRFTRGTGSAGFDLSDGEVIAVSSSEPRFETAAILVRAGKLEAAALERLSVPPGGDAALAAMGAGILTRREWKWGEKIRAIEVLSDLLGWPEGKYRFDANARPASGEFTLTIPRLLLELFLRSRDRNLIEHQLGPTDVALVRSADFDGQFATFGLTADAESVVQLIDGRATAAEVAREAPAEEFAVLKLLAALKTLSLLRTAPEESAASAPLESYEAGSEIEPAEPTRSVETDAVAGEMESAPEPDSGGAPLEMVHAASVEPTEDLAERQVGSEEWDAAEPETAPSLAAPSGLREASPDEADWSDIGLDAAPVSREEPTAAGPVELEASGSDLSDARLSSEEAAGGAAEPPGTWPEPESRGGGAPEPAPDSAPSRGGPGLVLTTIMLLLGAAVTAVLLVRSQARVPATSASSAASTAVPGAERPTAAPRTPETSAAPAPRSAAPAAPAAARPPAGEPARATRDWARRAERDRARLAGDRHTRYAIQLELACQEPSLVEAWKYDRPAGSMWLLPAAHEGRSCYRVLWGRYASIAEARGAKGGVPRFFSTITNHPAVVSVR